MSNKNKDLYYDPDALETIKEKISSLHKGYIVTGPASDANDVNSSSSKIRNILNSLDNYDDSYDNCFSKYDLSSKANTIYNKSQNFQDKWLNFDRAFVSSYNLLNESTTTAATILNEFEGFDDDSTTPRINSPYDYADYLKKQGKDKEHAALMTLLAGAANLTKKTGAKKTTENGANSKVNQPTNNNTAGYTTNTGATVTAYQPSAKDDSNSQEESQKLPTDEELRKKEEELLHKERELSDRETALDTREKQLQEKEKELEQREKELQEREEKLKNKTLTPTLTPNDHGPAQKPEDNNIKKEPTVEVDDVVSPPNEEQPTQQASSTPSEESPVTQINNPQPNNSYQNNNSQAANDVGQNTVAPPTNDVNNNSTVSETQTPSQKPIVDDSDIGNTTDLFGNSSDDNKGSTGVVTDLPTTDNSSQSTKSSKGFNPVPLAVGLGAAVTGGVGVKAYKNHKENSQFDDTNEDSFTNGNRFWSEDAPSVINTEQNELSGEELLKEQATSPSYSAISNGNNDTWSIDENSQNSGADNSTFDLLSNN